MQVGLSRASLGGEGPQDGLEYPSHPPWSPRMRSGQIEARAEHLLLDMKPLAQQKPPLAPLSWPAVHP